MNRAERKAVLELKYLYAATEGAMRKAEAGRWAEAALAVERAEGILCRVKSALWLARFGEITRGE